MFHRCYILIITLLVNAIIGYSQELEINWERIYGDFGEPPDSAYFILAPFSLLEHDDFGFVVGNLSQHWYPLEADTTAIWIFKTDWNGEIEWDYWLEDLWIYGYNHLEKTPNGEFILLASVFNEDGLYYPMLVRLDCDGWEIWRKSYEWLTSSSGCRSDMTIVENGHIVLMGSHNAPYLFFLDSDGDSLAYREYNIPAETGGYCFYNIIKFEHRHLLVNGWFHDIPRQRYFPMFLIVDEEGDSLRGELYNWDESRYRIDNIWLSNHGTIFCNANEIYFNGRNNDSTNAVLMEYNQDLELLWNRTYNFNKFDNIFDLIQLPDRRIVFVGSIEDNNVKYGWLQITGEYGDTLSNIIYRCNEFRGTYLKKCLSYNDDNNLIILGNIIDREEFWWSKSILIDVNIPQTYVLDLINPASHNILISPGFPNPFNSIISVQFSINNPQLVEISLFDNVGRVVCNQHKMQYLPGLYTFSWNHNLGSGSYFIRLKCNKYYFTIPIQLVK